MKQIFALMALAVSLFAGLSAGSSFPATTLDDQFEKRHTVSAEDRIVLISFERDVSNAVNAFLEKQPRGFLKVHNAKYIADISAMPTIISKLFALPKMRDYHYPVLLNYDEGFEKRFNKKEGKLTVYRLQAGMVVAVEFVDGGKIAEVFSK
jgi:hypothetical protein